jgi:hypothetical protein
MAGQVDRPDSAALAGDVAAPEDELACEPDAERGWFPGLDLEQLGDDEIGRIAREAVAILRAGPPPPETLDDLIPTEKELNEDPELDAWHAGVGPAPRWSWSTTPLMLRRFRLPLPLTPRRSRPRAQRRRGLRARLRARSPGREADDDDVDELAVAA